MNRTSTHGKQIGTERGDICPYCATRSRSSDDHIFPAFLGGKSTIRACKVCNDEFGHSFEGSVSADLTPAMISLRRYGLPTPKYMVWKNALKVDAIDYDLDSNLRAQPSRPNIWNETGGMKKVLIAQGRPGKQFIKGLEKSGRQIHSVQPQVSKLNLDMPITLSIPAHANLRRLSVKLCTAVADHFGHSQVLGAEARDFLLYAGADPTIIDIRIHTHLETLRQPFSHSVFVEGDREVGVCYGVAQFYGLLQIFVSMNRNFSGESFSVCALLHPAKEYSEQFVATQRISIGLPSAVAFQLQPDFEAKMTAWQKKMNREVQTLDTRASFKLRFRRPEGAKQRATFGSSTAAMTVFLDKKPH